MAKMDWRRCRYVGKERIDVRREGEFADRAQRWLQRAEGRDERRTIKPSRRTKIGITAGSTSGVPW
jgi:hypothetical protein